MHISRNKIISYAHITQLKQLYHITNYQLLGKIIISYAHITQLKQLYHITNYQLLHKISYENIQTNPVLNILECQ